MKIAIITSGFLPVVDGVTVSGLSRLQRLSKWGHEVLLFCPDYSMLESMYSNWRDYSGNILPGVRVVNVPSTPFMGLDFERNVGIHGYKVVIEELEKFQPDLIHVDEPERLFFGFFRIPGVRFARRKGIPCISFFRTNFLDYAEDYFPLPPLLVSWVMWFFKQIFVWIYNAYDITLVSSTVTRGKLVDLGIKNMQYANLLGFDGDRFSPSLRRTNFFAQMYGLPEVDRQVKLVFIGRLTPDKGWDFTLKILPKIAAEIDLNRVAFLIAGDGSIRDEILQTMSQFTPHVHLLGRVAPEQVPALLANSDLHVTTSEKETRGLTILEAFAAGIPVLAPRAGGVVENIEDGQNGLLYTPQDADDFVQKLKLLVDNEAMRQEMGMMGRAAIGHYNWDETVQNLVGVWQQAIEGQLKIKK
jgi:glycosyltransferase involved in cell wall biosynthesis